MKRLVLVTCLVAGCYSSEENLGFTAVGEPRWAISLGGRGSDEGHAVAIDSIGDVVAGGSFIGPADFGTGLEIVGGPWGFVTKRVGSDGAERWTHKLIGTTPASFSHVADIEVGPLDTVLVFGAYMGTIDFGGRALTLPPDKASVFIAAYSTDGQLLWVRSFNDSANPSRLAVDADGRIFVTGTFQRSTLDFNGTLFREADGDPDTFLVAYDPDGTLRWGTAFQASLPGSINGAGPVGTGIAIAANGDVLVTGTFTGPASVGGAILKPETRIRTYLTRFRNDGLYIASRTIGPASPISSRMPDLTVDAGGRIIIQQTEDDESTSPMARRSLATLRVFDDTHQELWSAQLQNNGSFSPQIRTLATTPDGLIISSAWTDNPYNADNRAAVPGAMEVVAYDEIGAAGMSTFGSRLLAAPAATTAYGTAVGSTGALAFTGSFAGTVDFGTGPVTTRGQDDSDIYIVLVDPPPPVATAR